MSMNINQFNQKVNNIVLKQGQANTDIQSLYSTPVVINSLQDLSNMQTTLWTWNTSLGFNIYFDNASSTWTAKLHS